MNGGGVLALVVQRTSRLLEDDVGANAESGKRAAACSSTHAMSFVSLRDQAT